MSYANHPDYDLYNDAYTSDYDLRNTQRYKDYDHLYRHPKNNYQTTYGYDYRSEISRSISTYIPNNTRKLSPIKQERLVVSEKKMDLYPIVIHPDIPNYDNILLFNYFEIFCKLFNIIDDLQVVLTCRLICRQWNDYMLRNDFWKHRIIHHMPFFDFDHYKHILCKPTRCYLFDKHTDVFYADNIPIIAPHKNDYKIIESKINEPKLVEELKTIYYDHWKKLFIKYPNKIFAICAFRGEEEVKFYIKTRLNFESIKIKIFYHLEKCIKIEIADDDYVSPIQSYSYKSPIKIAEMHPKQTNIVADIPKILMESREDVQRLHLANFCQNLDTTHHDFGQNKNLDDVRINTTYFPERNLNRSYYADFLEDNADNNFDLDKIVKSLDSTESKYSLESKYSIESKDSIESEYEFSSDEYNAGSSSEDYGNLYESDDDGEKIFVGMRKTLPITTHTHRNRFQDIDLT